MFAILGAACLDIGGIMHDFKLNDWHQGLDDSSFIISLFCKSDHLLGAVQATKIMISLIHLNQIQACSNIDMSKYFSFFRIGFNRSNNFWIFVTLQGRQVC